MTVNDSKIFEYIENFYHPYFDITLSKELDTNEVVNLAFSISELQNVPSNSQNTFKSKVSKEKYLYQSVNEIIEPYVNENVFIENGYKGICSHVIDGDTLKIDVTHLITNNKEKETDSVIEATIRLSSVNTPEEGQVGYDVAKLFTERLCLNNEIYIDLDIKKYDTYYRTLGVVYTHNCNLNEMLLNEGLAEIMYIPPTKFNPFEWSNKGNINRFKNSNSELLKVSPYINNDFTNICFTNQNNENLYRFEVFKDMLFIKILPYEKNIRMHILPKSYECDSNILIFKSPDIETSTDKFNINGYNKNPYLLSIISGYPKKQSSNELFEYSRDISKDTENFANLQINAGYIYTDTYMQNVFHLTGVKDKTNINPEEKCSLIDANYDRLDGATYSNNISQFIRTESEPQFPTKTNLNIKKSKSSMNINHLENIGEKRFHKTIKYINDDIYIEEEGKTLTCTWGDQS